MARVAKYSVAAIGNLFAHMERKQKPNKETGKLEYVKFGNRDIDTRFSPLNFRVWPPLSADITEARGIYVSEDTRNLFKGLNQSSEEPVLQRFRRLFHNTPHSNRKDLKCLCDWCLSLPDEIPVERMDELFDIALRYCCRLYGAENIVGAWVHVDEDHRPHLDVCFVPVANGRICAKEVLNRKHLKAWHGGLTSVVQEEMRINNPGIENGKTKEQGGNRTVKQMKAADKHYEKTKGREVAKWRAEQLKRLERLERGAGLLQNLLTDAAARQKEPLQPQRNKTFTERIRGL